MERCDEMRRRCGCVGGGVNNGEAGSNDGDLRLMGM